MAIGPQGNGGEGRRRPGGAGGRPVVPGKIMPCNAGVSGGDRPSIRGVASTAGGPTWGCAITLALPPSLFIPCSPSPLLLLLLRGDLSLLSTVPSFVRKQGTLQIRALGGLIYAAVLLFWALYAALSLFVVRFLKGLMRSGVRQGAFWHVSRECAKSESGRKCG